MRSISFFFNETGYLFTFIYSSSDSIDTHFYSFIVIMIVRRHEYFMSEIIDSYRCIALATFIVIVSDNTSCTVAA